jgi:hypothetical protein
MFTQQRSVDSESLVHPDIRLLGFALIPIIAMGHDVIIARNIDSLHRLGTFIRNELEPLAPSMRSNLWETRYGQPDTSKPKDHGAAEINFLSLFTLGTEIIATAIYLNTQRSYLILIAVLFLFHIRVFLYMDHQILQFDTFENEKD